MGRGLPFIDRRESPEKSPLPSLTSILDASLFTTALETVLLTYYIKIVNKACQIRRNQGRGMVKKGKIFFFFNKDSQGRLP